MPTKKSAIPSEIYQLKVTLLGTHPPIWRRLLVPANMTLADLDAVLQTAMGWDGSHLHEFCVGHEHFGPSDLEDPEVEDERTVRLSGILGRVGAKAVYTYDFGDDWNHALVLEKRLPADPDAAYPACTGGKRACPPEDCGGVDGYYDLAAAMADPNHERHEEFRQWIGRDFDPEAFSVDDINRRLVTLQRRRR